MSSTSSNKKLHFFDLPDGLEWSNKEQNQRLMMRTPTTPTESNQLLLVHPNDLRSTEAKEHKKSPRDNKPKSAKGEPSPSKVNEPKPRSKASTSTDHVREGNFTSTRNRTSEPLEIVRDKHSKPKLSITLTREEIEEDFWAMTGRKLPRNMMKRDKNLQKDLDALVPGHSLEGECAETLRKKYK